ncbi:MAG: DUF4190 domain-containing protein [Actinomycetota bacterium]
MTDNNTPGGYGDRPAPPAPPAAPSAQAPSSPGYPSPPAYPGAAASGGYPAPSPGVAPYAQAPGYPQAPSYGSYQGYPQPQPTNGLALTSMITGIVGWILIPILASIVAIVTGHMGLNQLRQKPAGGRGMAIAGLILGYSAIALWGVGIFFFLAIFGIAASTGY